jgi:hypothetical protein
MSSLTPMLYNMIQVPNNINYEINIISYQIFKNIKELETRYNSNLLFELNNNYKELFFKINTCFESFKKIIKFIDDIQIRYDKQIYCLQKQTKNLKEEIKKLENIILEKEKIILEKNINSKIKVNNGIFTSDLIPKLDY